MSKDLKDDLKEMMKKYGPEKVDSITDKDSAIKHFRTSSEVYKELGEGYKRERDEIKRENEMLRKQIVDLKEKEVRIKETETALYWILFLLVVIAVTQIFAIFLFWKE